MRAFAEPLQPSEIAQLRIWRSQWWCEDCQRAHDRQDRQRVLRRLLPMEAADLRAALTEGWPCLYGPFGRNSCDAASKRLQRDLRDLGAALTVRRDFFLWSL